nr:MAG TPA: hypothetical protein [Bacteriophage sp.]
MVLEEGRINNAKRKDYSRFSPIKQTIIFLYEDLFGRINHEPK